MVGAHAGIDPRRDGIDPDPDGVESKTPPGSVRRPTGPVDGRFENTAEAQPEVDPGSADQPAVIVLAGAVPGLLEKGPTNCVKRRTGPHHAEGKKAEGRRAEWNGDGLPNPDLAHSTPTVSHNLTGGATTSQLPPHGGVVAGLPPLHEIGRRLRGLPHSPGQVRSPISALFALVAPLSWRLHWSRTP